jgi:hypothetical protein
VPMGQRIRAVAGGGGNAPMQRHEDGSVEVRLAGKTTYRVMFA